MLNYVLASLIVDSSFTTVESKMYYAVKCTALIVDPAMSEWAIRSHNVNSVIVWV